MLFYSPPLGYLLVIVIHVGLQAGLEELLPAEVALHLAHVRRVLAVHDLRLHHLEDRLLEVGDRPCGGRQADRCSSLGLLPILASCEVVIQP